MKASLQSCQSASQSFPRQATLRPQGDLGDLAFFHTAFAGLILMQAVHRALVMQHTPQAASSSAPNAHSVTNCLQVANFSTTSSTQYILKRVPGR